MSSITNIGIAGSYIAKISNIQDTLHVGDGISGPFGYQTSDSTAPTISMSTNVLFLTGGSTSNCTFPSAVTGQSIFIKNNNSNYCTLGAVSLNATRAGLMVYNGTSWIKFIDTTFSE